MPGAPKRKGARAQKPGPPSEEEATNPVYFRTTIFLFEE